MSIMTQEQIKHWFDGRSVRDFAIKTGLNQHTIGRVLKNGATTEGTLRVITARIQSWDADHALKIGGEEHF